MSYSLNSKLLKGVVSEIREGNNIGAIKGDTRSLDHNPHNPLYNPSFHVIVHVLFHLILHYRGY